MSISAPWPMPGDYTTAVQNPQSCFIDHELKSAKVTSFRSGMPRRWCGRFAIVYQLHSPKRKLAVRCFIKPVSNQQQQRYRLLHEHIIKVRIPALSVPVYLNQGIWLSGKPHPVVLMEWIHGKQLHQYVEDHIQDQNSLGQIADQWRHLMLALRGARTAHGDLQHGNVLIDEQGLIHLVDYDGMYIPALRGQPPAEVGHVNYQHPDRIQRGFYEENVDGFSALAIYLSIIAVRADSRLWKAYHSGENLIFSAQDFREPGRTRMWGELDQSSDIVVRRLTAELENFCRLPVSAVPNLEEVLQGARHPSPQRSITSPNVASAGAKAEAPKAPNNTKTRSQIGRFLKVAGNIAWEGIDPWGIAKRKP